MVACSPVWISALMYIDNLIHSLVNRVSRMAR